MPQHVLRGGAWRMALMGVPFCEREEERIHYASPLGFIDLIYDLDSS